MIASGKSGIYSWRKWSDGTAECWGIAEFTDGGSWPAWGSLYQSGDPEQPPDFPAGLFVEAPACTMSPQHCGGWQYFIGIPPDGETTKDRPSKIEFFRGSAMPSGTPTWTQRIGIEAKGRWK